MVNIYFKHSKQEIFIKQPYLFGYKTVFFPLNLITDFQIILMKFIFQMKISLVENSKSIDHSYKKDLPSGHLVLK